MKHLIGVYLAIWLTLVLSGINLMSNSDTEDLSVVVFWSTILALMLTTIYWSFFL